jgi:hypothetical protein
MGNHRNSSFIKHSVGIFAALTVVIISILLAFAAVAPNSHRRGPPVESTSVIGSYVPQAFSLVASDSDPHTVLVGRPLFPFSVVPGGVDSPQELLNAIGNDPTVARHYAGFDAPAAHVVTLHQDLRAYVSYRIGGGIFWTKKPITLRKNETVIIDGNIEARTRCGNRVSAIPQLPISTREPSPKALDAAQIPEIANLPMDSFSFRPVPNLVPGENNFATTGGETVFTSVIPPFIWEPTPPIIPPHHRPHHPPVPPPPPIVTSEPGTGLFFVLALSAFLLAKFYGTRHEF